MLRRSAGLLLAFALLSWLLIAGTSLAYAGYEGTATPEPFLCEQCHAAPDETSDYGPHGTYLSSSDKCSTCHSVHAATGAVALMPGPTVKATCELCHDGTGGGGVYGALAARGVPVQASHRVDVTNVVPGGSALTGHETTRTFVGDDGMLGCDDCHSPHNSNTVAEFQGERYRGNGGMMFGWDYYPDVGPTSKLLKKRPTGGPIEVAEYGSDWCAACHAGRPSGGVVHNHPADSILTTTSPFDYNHVAVLDSASRTNGTILRAVTDGTYQSGYAMDNRAFLMPDPRTPQQAGHYPICQQCHEDSRAVGDLTAAGGLAAPFVVTPGALADQYPVTDNPRFQNFPLETANSKMLVETDDDLCANCHLAEKLP
jgi:hypothetical protein